MLAFGCVILTSRTIHNSHEISTFFIKLLSRLFIKLYGWFYSTEDSRGRWDSLERVTTKKRPRLFSPYRHRLIAPSSRIFSLAWHLTGVLLIFLRCLPRTVDYWRYIFYRELWHKIYKSYFVLLVKKIVLCDLLQNKLLTYLSGANKSNLGQRKKVCTIFTTWGNSGIWIFCKILFCIKQFSYFLLMP